MIDRYFGVLMILNIFSKLRMDRNVIYGELQMIQGLLSTPKAGELCSEMLGDG